MTTDDEHEHQDAVDGQAPRTVGGLPPARPWLVRAGAESTESAALKVFAALIGADYSARSITPQRADQAPASVRSALPRFSSFDAHAQHDLADAGVVWDGGDAGAADAATWEFAWHRIARLAESAHVAAPFVAALGGDHSVSWPLITVAAAAAEARVGRPQRMGVLQLDAHHDVRPLADGPLNGTPFRGLVEQGVVRGEDIVQLGIHPFGNRPELAAWCDEQGIRRFGVDLLLGMSHGELAVLVREALADVDVVYLSVDIDVLDRAAAPGTVAALPGGLDVARLTAIVRAACTDPRTVAMDVVEFDPTRDVADITVRACCAVLLAGLSSVATRDRRLEPNA